MVEQGIELNAVFRSLSDPTRRDILKKVSSQSQSVSAIAAHYPMTFAAVAKHLEVLHRAKLITKQRRGTEQIVNITPLALSAASDYLESYRQLWEHRLDGLETYLQTIKKKKKKEK